jgi:hypothetical protein
MLTHRRAHPEAFPPPPRPMLAIQTACPDCGCLTMICPRCMRRRPRQFSAEAHARWTANLRKALAARGLTFRSERPGAPAPSTPD